MILETCRLMGVDLGKITQLAHDLSLACVRHFTLVVVQGSKKKRKKKARTLMVWLSGL